MCPQVGRRRAAAIIAATLCIVPRCRTPLQAAVLPERIESDTVLTAGGSPWEMRSNVTIAAGADVTVEPDVRVVAHGDYRLTVSGSLTAMSPMGSRIVFRAPNNSSTGAWKGIYFTPGATGRFQRCTFRSATDNIMADGADVRLYNCHVRLASRDGLMAWGDGFLKCAYCRFQNNGRHGLHIVTTRQRGAVIYSEFIGSGEEPVRVKATCLEMLHRGNTYAHNGRQAIAVDCDALTDIEDGDYWRDQDLPLDMTAGSESADLVIDDGAALRIESGIRIYPPRRIVVRGRLCVDGLAGAPVVIQPLGQAQAGDWLGIEVEPGGVVRMRDATVGFARNGFTVDDGGLYLSHVLIRDSEHDGLLAGGRAHVDMARCTVADCADNGMHMPQRTSTGKIHDTHFARCGGYPVRVAATVAEALRAGNSYRDNARQAVGVVCGLDYDINDDDAWLPQGVPFDLTADPGGTNLRVTHNARLCLRAGVEVVGGTVTATGILVAAGRPDAPVVFGSPNATPAPGDWTGIEYIGGSAGRLVNTVVRHAETGARITSDGCIRLVDSVFELCRHDGVHVARTAMPIITGCTIRDNGRWGLAVADSAFPLVGSDGEPANPGRNSLYGNGEYDLANLSGDAILAQHNWWGTTDQASIGAHILDRGENAGYGPVNFVPFLQSVPSAAATVASAPRPPLAVMGVAAVPTASGAAIHVTLSRPAEVRVMVRNIAGRPIRTLHARVERSGVVPWNGRDERGSLTPSGQYLVEVEALAADGSRSRALSSLALRR